MSGRQAEAPVLTTLVLGANAAARETAIAALLEPGTRSCIILEGLPDGSAHLAAGALPAPAPAIHRIAPGCLCCAGNLVLRVTLNRILRHRPDRLFLGLATAGHSAQLRQWLSQPPYASLLALTPDLHAPELRRS